MGGCLILLAGAGLTLAAIAQSIPWLFLAGTAVAGLGFGAAWTGAYRMLTAAVAPADRAGLVDAIFIAAYLALSLPTVIAGRNTYRLSARKPTMRHGQPSRKLTPAIRA